MKAFHRYAIVFGLLAFAFAPGFGIGNEPLQSAPSVHPVLYFRAVRAERGVRVQWAMHPSSRFQAFHIERVENGGKAVRLTVEPLVLDPFEAPPFPFEAFDAHAGHPERRLYRLIGVDEASGETVILEAMIEIENQPAPDKILPATALAAAETLSFMTLSDSTTSGDRVKVFVRNTGLYFVEDSAIADVLEGQTAAGVRDLIAARRLRLSRGGAEVSWYAAPGSTGLYFLGFALPDDPYAITNVYWIDRVETPVAPMATRASAAVQWQSSFTNMTFRSTVRHEEDDSSLNFHLFPHEHSDPNADMFPWFVVVARNRGVRTPVTRTFLVNHPIAGPGAVAFSLVGKAHGFRVRNTLDYRTDVSLNGVSLLDETWSGWKKEYRTFNGQGSVALIHGTNTMIVGQTPQTATWNGFIVDAFSLTYSRYYNAVGNLLECVSPEGGGAFGVGAFSHADVHAFDISDPDRPVRILGISISEQANGFTAAINDGALSRPYIFAASGPRPALGGVWSSGLRSSSTEAEYVVVFADSLQAQAQELLAYRSATGLSVKGAPISEIFDEFSHGLPSPTALQELIRHAQAHWATPPRYLALLGVVSHDTKNVKGLNNAVVPVPRLWVSYEHIGDSDYGLFFADTLAADSDGDRRPDIAIGRIPVDNAADFNRYFAKVKAFEVYGDWRKRIFFSADIVDPGAGNFALTCRNIAALVTSDYSITNRFLDEVAATVARAAATNFINAGGTFFVYFGHGNQTLFAAANRLILGRDDSVILTGSNAPLGLLMGCSSVDLAWPSGSLGVRYLRSSGGFSGVFGECAPALHTVADALTTHFFAGYFNSNAKTVGNLYVDAMRATFHATTEPKLAYAYQWIGDPALRIKNLQRHGSLIIFW